MPRVSLKNAIARGIILKMELYQSKMQGGLFRIGISPTGGTRPEDARDPLSLDFV